MFCHKIFRSPARAKHLSRNVWNRQEAGVMKMHGHRCLMQGCQIRIERTIFGPHRIQHQSQASDCRYGAAKDWQVRHLHAGSAASGAHACLNNPPPPPNTHTPPRAHTYTPPPRSECCCVQAGCQYNHHCGVLKPLIALPQASPDESWGHRPPDYPAFCSGNLCTCPAALIAGTISDPERCLSAVAHCGAARG